MDFKRLNTASEVASLIEHHNDRSTLVVLDVETTSADPRKAKLLEIQLTGFNDDSVCIFDAEFAYYLNLLDKSLAIVAHNGKYDAHVLYRHGIDLLDRAWRDTIILGHLADENRESYSLDSYVKEYWNDDYKERFWSKYEGYQEAAEEDKLWYAADIIYAGRLYRNLTDILQKRENIPDSLIRHAHRLQSSLLKTEIEGLSVDSNYLTDLGIRIKNQIDEIVPRMRSSVADEIEILELEAWTKALSLKKSEKGKRAVKRGEFNFESSAQLPGLLYGRLGLPPQRNEKTKSISTDFASLEKIKHLHPVVELIQKNRELQKVYGTYIEGTIDRLDQERIYPKFNVAGTVTGRLSHNSPNMAQLPTTGGVRGIYVPDRGRVLISADYSQLEVVIEANLTGDKNLIRMLENGESKHDLTARELRCDRATAKTLNFALQYWCSHFKVAKLLGCSVNEGKRIWEQYWKIYSGPKLLKDRTDREIDEGIPLVTCYGRKRRFAIGKRPEWSGDYRQGYNFKIQSPGGDFMSEAFYTVDEILRDRDWGRGWFTVHDEGLIEARPEKAEEAEKLLVDTMESMGVKYKLKIPLKAQSSGPMKRWED